MQKKISSLSVLVAGIVALAALQASNAVAQWYVSGNIGTSILADSDVSAVDSTGSFNGDFSTDPGVAVMGAVGYALKNLRIEGEISYRHNGLDELTINTFVGGGLVFVGVATGPIEGDMTALGFMANAFYDFDTGSNWVPYLGGGLGVAQLGLDVESIGGLPTTFDETDTVFAYQFGAGVGYSLGGGARVDLSYRFMGTTDPKFSDGVATVKSEYYNHAVMAGLLFKF